MNNWTIRPFRIDDYVGARALWEASKGIGLDESDSRDRIEAFLARNQGLSSVADLDGAIVGAVLCGQDGRRALVYHLAVADEHRRQGVGAALVRASLAKLRGQGIHKCHILVFGENHEALLFWKHIGAKERTDLVLSSIDTGGAAKGALDRPRTRGAMMSVKGSCLCGGIQYEVDGEFRTAVNCHCSMCRKATGAAFRTRASIPVGAFRWMVGEDLVSRFESSPGETRTFCRICGATLATFFGEGSTEIGLPLGTLDDDPGVRPSAHVFVGSKAPWFEITDHLPQFSEAIVVASDGKPSNPALQTADHPDRFAPSADRR